MNKSLNKDKKSRFEICEMFMAKADRYRCFFGIIKRFEDHSGNPLVFSKICLPDDGYIVAQSTDQKTLGIMLDELCIMTLDIGINEDAGASIEIFGSKYFLN